MGKEGLSPSFYSLSVKMQLLFIFRFYNGKKSLSQCNMKTLGSTFIDKFRVDIKIQSDI